MKPMTKTFRKYLDRMQMAQTHSQNILRQWSPSSETLQASLACAWEIFFDLLQHQEEISLTDLNAISGIIQKLSSCHSQLSTLESKNRHDHNDDETSSTPPMQLSQEIIEAIEQQLQLL
jgi:hypothetical protein